MRSTTDAPRGRPGDAGLIQSFEIWPHRSLDRRGRTLLVTVVAIGVLLSAIRSPAPALLPIALAGLMTVGAMSLALWSNTRSARRGEIVEVGPDVVRIVRMGVHGPEASVHFSTGWVRVAVSHDRQMAHRLTFSEKGRVCSVGECLSPAERQELAAAIRASLAQARAAGARQVEQTQSRVRASG